MSFLRFNCRLVIELLSPWIHGHFLFEHRANFHRHKDFVTSQDASEIPQNLIANILL